MSFQPAMHQITVPTKDVVLSGWNFAGFDHGTISGRVSTGGRPMDGVLVSAMPAAGGVAVDTATTGVTGTYSLSVAFGRYKVEAAKKGFTFTPATQPINVGPGESRSIEDFAAVVVASEIATLSGLSLGDEVNVVPTFADSVTTYTASAANSVEQVTVTTTTTDAGATVAILPVDADATTGHQVDLVEGTGNVITATVTAADGSTTKTYTVTVTRRPPALLNDATLASLGISEGTLAPAFASGVIAYAAEVENTVEQVTVTAATSHADATFTITFGSDDAVAPNGVVNLTTGANTITVNRHRRGWARPRRTTSSRSTAVRMSRARHSSWQSHRPGRLH